MDVDCKTPVVIVERCLRLSEGHEAWTVLPNPKASLMMKLFTKRDGDIDPLKIKTCASCHPTRLLEDTIRDATKLCCVRCIQSPFVCETLLLILSRHHIIVGIHQENE